MGGMQQEASINNLVGFLGSFAPQSLRSLRAAYPDARALQEGQQLGPLAASSALRVDVAMRALISMAALAEAAANRLLRRMRAANLVELGGQLVGLVASGGMLAAVLSETDARLQLIGAVVAMLGSATALGAKFLRRDVLGTEGGLVKLYGELIRSNADAVELQARLAPYARSRDDFGEPGALSEHIEKANVLAGVLYRLLKLGGYAVPVALQA